MKQHTDSDQAESHGATSERKLRRQTDRPSVRSLGRGGEDLTFTHRDRAIRAYRAVPASGRGRGVLVLHDAAGLVDSVRDACDRLAREGFVALAPDLLAGRTSMDPEAALRTIEELDLDRAVEDMEAATTEMFSFHGTDGANIGAVGFGAGGPLALLAACENRRISAVASFYGWLPAAAPSWEALEASVLCIFAEKDENVPAETVADLDQELRLADVAATVRTQPGVGPEFMNDARPDCYDAAASTAGWDQLLVFLRAETG